MKKSIILIALINLVIIGQTYSCPCAATQDNRPFFEDTEEETTHNEIENDERSE